MVKLNWHVNYLVIILALLLCSSVFINLRQGYLLIGPSIESITGTYNSISDENRTSLVFLSHGRYVAYQPGEVLSTGTFSLADAEEKIVNLEPEGKDCTFQFIYRGAKLYCFDLTGRIITYQKISNNAVYVGIKPSDLTG